MQLSLFNSPHTGEKRIFLDIFAKMQHGSSGCNPVLKAIGGQLVPAELKVKCLKHKIALFPEGTIFKLDVRLVTPSRQSAYLTAIKNKNITRAVEFFEYNITLQREAQNPKKEKAKKRNQPKERKKGSIRPINILKIPFHSPLNEQFA